MKISEPTVYILCESKFGDKMCRLIWAFIVLLCLRIWHLTEQVLFDYECNFLYLVNGYVAIFHT